MMHKALPPKRNVSRLYIPRKEGGRGLLSVEDIINLAVIGLERYVNNSEERLLSAGKRIWRQSNEYGDNQTNMETVKRIWRQSNEYGDSQTNMEEKVKASSKPGK